MHNSITKACMHEGSTDLLRAIDDEVAPRVKGALVDLVQVTVGQATQEAICRPQHDGNFT